MMMRKAMWMMCLSAAAFVGCQSNNTKTADAGHEPAVCDMPGQGAPSKAVVKAAPVAVFGGEQKLTDADTVPVSKVIDTPADYKNKYVRMTGKVSSVCEKKGCWLRVVPDQTAAGEAPKGDVFIKFKDPPAGRLVPLEAVGHKVTVEGTLKQGMMSEAQARHFKEDAGAPKEEIEKIVGPQPQLVLTTPVVAIEGVERPGE